MTISEAWVDFIAGWASGAAAVLLCQPVDTVLTRLQAGQQLTTATAAPTHPSTTIGMETVGRSAITTIPRSTIAPSVLALQQARGLIASFGMTSLWRGSSAMISAVPLQNAMLMGGYGIGKQWATMYEESNQYQSNQSNNTTNANSSGATAAAATATASRTTLISVFVGGCTGGIVQSFLMSPVELMKVNQQVVGKSATAAGKDLLAGMTSTSWRGLNATLLRDGIPHGVWFATYEWCKTDLQSRWLGEAEAHSPGKEIAVPLLSGAVAATVAWAVGYPFDIIKTRIQATKPQYSQGIYETAVQLVEEANGRVMLGLYRGFSLKLVRAVPASMIGFTTYEMVAKQIRN